MNFNRASWTGLLLVGCLGILSSAQSTAETFDYDEFERRSLLFALQDKRASFSSEIQMVNQNLDPGLALLEEKYSFGQEVGEYWGEQVMDLDGKIEVTTAKTIYSVNLPELYQIIQVPRKCESFPFDLVKEYIQRNWSPLDLSKNSYPILGEQKWTFLKVLCENFKLKPFQFEIQTVLNSNANSRKRSLYHLGPNVLWLVFLDKLRENQKIFRKPVHCVQLEGESALTECAVDFTKDSITIKYVFKQNEHFSMIPNKILVFNMNEPVMDKPIKQFNYLNFSATFAREPIVSLNLPIGKNNFKSLLVIYVESGHWGTLS